MKHSLSVNGNQATVIVNGKIYAHDAGILRDDVLDAIEKGIKFIRMNLVDTTYIDSSGLGVLVTIHKLSKEKEGGLVLTGVQGMVAELLRRTRLDRTLSIE
ncbi:MAG: anti-anti-sigma factor [Firmicutes bacterium]|nr:anti-anti-sigma factor [Bacillota bacterium]